MADFVDIKSNNEITRLLARLRGGCREAFDEIFPVLYQHLHMLAHRVRRGQASDTPSTTTLVHEAYLKLSSCCSLSCEDRRHFFAVAARAMRQIILDHARETLAGKRGGAAIHVSLDGVEIAVQNRALQFLHLDEALHNLTLLDPNLARIVELRFFAGLTVEDTSEVLETSARTVKREWRKARAFLLQELLSDESVRTGGASGQG